MVSSAIGLHHCTATTFNYQSAATEHPTTNKAREHHALFLRQWNTILFIFWSSHYKKNNHNYIIHTEPECFLHPLATTKSSTRETVVLELPKRVLRGHILEYYCVLLTLTSHIIFNLGFTFKLFHVIDLGCIRTLLHNRALEKRMWLVKSSGLRHSPFRREGQSITSLFSALIISKLTSQLHFLWPISPRSVHSWKFKKHTLLYTTRRCKNKHQTSITPRPTGSYRYFFNIFRNTE